MTTDGEGKLLQYLLVDKFEYQPLNHEVRKGLWRAVPTQRSRKSCLVILHTFHGPVIFKLAK